MAAGSVDASEVAAAFADMAESLARGNDIPTLVTDVLDHVRAVLGVAATGILLLDGDGELRSARSSPAEAVLLDSVQADHDEGPGRDCVRAGRAVAVADLRGTGDRWPRFARLCHQVGIGAVDALPVGHGKAVFGALLLYRTAPGPLGDDADRIGRAFAEATGAGLRLRRSIEHNATVMGQLEHALDSRVVIEQAKGMVAAQHHLSIDRAFATLRAHARRNNIRLTDLCHAVTAGIIGPPAPGPS